jgi:hypothetical protein
MSEVKRYDAVHIRYEERNIRYGEGCEVEMVAAYDYDALAAENQRLREELRAQSAPAEVAQGEAFAWFTEDYGVDKSATTYDRAVAERWRVKGWPVTAMYMAPPSHDAELMELLRECAKSFAVWNSSPALKLKDRIDAKLASL